MTIEADEAARLGQAITHERQRTVEQIDGLQRNYDGIVEAVRLISTDDEHDPEGSTIAYERAQVWSLLQQANDELALLDRALERLADGTLTTCTTCGGPIAPERVLALPGVLTCIRCAR